MVDKASPLEARQDARFEADQLRSNLQLNDQQILECRGRLDGEYPIYLRDNHPFTTSLVEQAHISTLHGGVWNDYGKNTRPNLGPSFASTCQESTIELSPAKLPITRTQGSTPFQVLGVDFAGPIRYQVKGKNEKKAYLALFACSLTRAVHLELVRSLETEDFIMCFKKFIARRGRPELNSDNAQMFKATVRWLKKVRKNEQFNDYLARLEIKRRFNLSGAPGGGGGVAV